MLEAQHTEQRSIFILVMLFLEVIGSTRCLFQPLDFTASAGFITLCLHILLATHMLEEADLWENPLSLRWHRSESYKNSYSQHLEYFHIAAKDPVCLGTQLDAHGTTSGADHQAVNQVGLTVVANICRQLLVGRIVALHFHMDLVRSDDDWFEAGFGQSDFLRDQVRTRVEKPQG